MKQKKGDKPYVFLKSLTEKVFFKVRLLTQNSGKALALRFEHWTPKGDCKVTGNKERNPLQFYEENPFKNEQTQIIEN